MIGGQGREGVNPGDQKTIYWFDPDDETFTQLDAQLSVARERATAMYVDQLAFPECN